MNMPEIRRQHGKATLHVLAGPIPLDQSLHSKAVTKVVKTRPVAVRRATQSDLPRQEIERASDLSAVQAGSTAGYEER